MTTETIDGVRLTTKANVYFDGKCVSHSFTLADGNMLQNGFHEISLQSDSCKRFIDKHLGLKRLEISASRVQPGSCAAQA